MSKFKKFAIRGATTIAALLIAATPIVKQVYENQQRDEIKENANINNIPRSFNNIDEQDMGKYLKETIEYLYDKYPDLDELVYSESELLQNDEFLDDIYLLYKAEMVDRKGKEEVNINDVKVRDIDRIVIHSNKIEENGKKITNTFEEPDKYITEVYRKEDKNLYPNGAIFAKTLYEYLVNIHGTKENVLTSDQIAKRMEEQGFYFEPTSGRFYTPEGEADLVVRTTPEQQIEGQQQEDNGR